MKNIMEILSELGITVPEDKQTALNKAVAENYKTIAEHEKKVNRLTDDLNAEKQRADTAVETLKGFEGIDPADLNNQIEKWKQRAEQAEKDAQAKLDERDFNDALKAEMDGYKFTSSAAKRAVMSEIQAAGLKLKNGKILGLQDLIDQIRKDDASAFVDDHQEQLESGRARFTSPANRSGGQVNSLTKNDIMSIKDPRERQDAIAKNISLFQKENK